MKKQKRVIEVEATMELSIMLGASKEVSINGLEEPEEIIGHDWDHPVGLRNQEG